MKQYKKILYKCLSDEAYYKTLKYLINETCLSFEDSAHWLEQFAIINSFTKIDGKDYLGYIVDLANKGYNREAIEKELVKALN